MFLLVMKPPACTLRGKKGRCSSCSLCELSRFPKVLRESSKERFYFSSFQVGGLNQECSVIGFPGGAVVENLPADAGATGSSPGPGRSHMSWSK